MKVLLLLVFVNYFSSSGNPSTANDLDHSREVYMFCSDPNLAEGYNQNEAAISACTQSLPALRKLGSGCQEFHPTRK